jgi:hypothetical protein
MVSVLRLFAVFALVFPGLAQACGSYAGYFIFALPFFIAFFVVVGFMLYGLYRWADQDRPQGPPSYNWRCPRCESGNAAGTEECKECGWHINKKYDSSATTP